MEVPKNLEYIEIKASMADKKGQLIPHGVTETVTIKIIDEYAMVKFKDGRICKKFAMVSRDAGSKTVFNERLQQAITNYPGKKKEEIKEILEKALESFR